MLGIKTDDSIHSVSSCQWAMGVIVSADETQTPAYKIWHTYSRYQKRWIDTFRVLPSCLWALEYSVSVDEIQTLTYQLCHTYARY